MGVKNDDVQKHEHTRPGEHIAELKNCGTKLRLIKCYHGSINTKYNGDHGVCARLVVLLSIQESDGVKYLISKPTFRAHR